MTLRARHRAPAWRILLAYLLLIIYASWYPFSGWHNQGLSPLIFLVHTGMPRYWTKFDAIINVIGYIPFGMLIAVEWGYGFRGVNADGSLGLIARARVDRALQLFEMGIAPRIIFTGKCGLMSEASPAVTVTAPVTSSEPLRQGASRAYAPMNRLSASARPEITARPRSRSCSSATARATARKWTSACARRGRGWRPAPRQSFRRRSGGCRSCRRALRTRTGPNRVTRRSRTGGPIRGGRRAGEARRELPAAAW